MAKEAGWRDTLSRKFEPISAEPAIAGPSDSTQQSRGLILENFRGSSDLSPWQLSCHLSNFTTIGQRSSHK